MGGGSSEKLDSNSSFYQILRKSGYSPLESNQIVKNSPTYWGNQPFVEAPAYVGIAVIFFIVLFQFFCILTFNLQAQVSFDAKVSKKS